MPKPISHLVAVLSCLVCALSVAQEARLRPAGKLSFPTATDGNSSSFWLNDRLHLFTSIGWPVELSAAFSQFDEWETREVDTSEFGAKSLWLESAWVDADGTVFAWYHNEPWGMYEDSFLTAPKIGAIVSFDGGKTIHDLGIILESGDPLNDQAQNGAFTGGHGDFSVVLDREQKYFYFFFSNYGGTDESQGVAVARMAFADRLEPKGKIYKYYNGAWNEPGVGGRITPVFPVVRGWQYKDPDAFWGPALHWNTYLNNYVMLLNHTQGEPGWTQEGMYVSFAKDLSRPDTWKKPGKILDNSELPDWGIYYPQVMGLEAGGTDTLAGKTARFYVNGGSKWEIDFFSSNEVTPPSLIDRTEGRHKAQPR